MKKIKGFSIIELIIIMAILGLLAALAIPQFKPVSTKAKIKAAKGAMKSIMSALDMWSIENCPRERLTQFYFPAGPVVTLRGFYNNYLTAYLANYPGPAFGYKASEDVTNPNFNYNSSSDRSGYTIVIKERWTNTPITGECFISGGTLKKIITGVYQGKDVPYP